MTSSALAAHIAGSPEEALYKEQIAFLGDRYAGHRLVGQEGRQFPIFYVKRSSDSSDSLIEKFFGAYDKVLVEMVDRSLADLEALKEQALALRAETDFPLLTVSIDERNNRVLLTFSADATAEDRACFLGLLGNPAGVAAVNVSVDDPGDGVSVIAKGRVYVRTGPSTDKARAKILGQLKKGDAVDLFLAADAFDDWYCIRCGDGIGYVKKQYFTVPEGY